MARGQRGFYWKSDTLRPNVKGFPQRVDRAVTAAVDYTATRAEGTMKRNAPWTDRTSNARNGLFAATEHSPSLHRIILAHSVNYGIWLEVRWSGRYQIIRPTLTSAGQELMGLLHGMISGRYFK